MYHNFLIHSFTDGHLDCFQHVAIVNNAGMNIGVHRFFWMGASGLLRHNPSIGITGSRAVPSLVFWWNSILFSTRFWSPKYGKNLCDYTPGRQTTLLKNGQRTWTDTYFSKEDIQRTQRHMKGCLASLAIREMQIKTTMRCHFTPVRMAIINKSTNNKCWRRCAESRTLVYYWWGCRLVHPLWKTMEFPQKAKMKLPFDPVVPHPGLYPKNPETPIQ